MLSSLSVGKRSHMNTQDSVLIEKFEKMVSHERRTTADIVECLKEIDRRKLYLQLGHTSLFAYLTNGLGYSAASAQRRIYAARMMQSDLEIKNDLSSGALNLMQVSMIAQAVRAKDEFVPPSEKRELISAIKGKDLRETQKIICQKLDVQLKAVERERFQKDESTRLEISFSKEDMQILKQIKDLLSHKNPSANWHDVMMATAEEYVQRNDPEAQKQKRTSKMEYATSQPKQIKKSLNQILPAQATSRRSIPAATKRFIYQRDRCCQWRDSKISKICGSTFQLEIDHRQSVWAGGGNERKNLRLLCRAHNQLKYANESRTREI